ncbi:MAG: hypothetical protein U0575_11540 [Phycisphaerales bacterium]
MAVVVTASETAIREAHRTATARRRGRGVSDRDRVRTRATGDERAAIARVYAMKGNRRTIR